MRLNNPRGNKTAFQPLKGTTSTPVLFDMEVLPPGHKQANRESVHKRCRICSVSLGQLNVAPICHKLRF